VIYLSPRFYLDTAVDPSPPPLQAAGKGLIPYSEVNKHDNEGDCWVVINGKVYDLTEVRLFFISSVSSGGKDARPDRNRHGPTIMGLKIRGLRIGISAYISSPVKLTQAVQPQFTEQQEKMLRQFSTHSIHLGLSKMAWTRAHTRGWWILLLSQTFFLPLHRTKRRERERLS
jgi:hypothetical protein